jgi:YVTN family beta-propeller protein
VNSSQLSRRSLLLASAGVLACRQQKAIGFRGSCFVANQESRSITVVDLNRFRVRKGIALDAAPASVLAHSGRGKVFVLAPEAGTVYEIDAASLAVTRRARAGNLAAGMQFSTTSDALWVLYRDPAALVEFPLDSLRPNRRIRLSAPASNFDVSRDNQAAVISPQDGSIVLASLSRGTIDKTIMTGTEPSLIKYRWDAKHVLVGSGPDRSVTIYDVPTGRVVVRLPLPLEPKNFCVSADNGQLFVSGDGMDAVVIIFPSSTEVDQTILAGHAPGAMAVTKGVPTPPPYLLVANPDSDKVTVFDIDTRELVAVVQVGRGPRSIHMTPDDEYALVLNQESGDMAVIRTRSLVSPDGSARRYKAAPLFTLIPVGEKPVGAAVVAFG